MEIFKSLNSSDIIEDFEFLDYKKWQDGYCFKLRITLKDNPEQKKGDKNMNQLRPLFILFAVAAMVTLTAGSLHAAEKIDINTASVRELTQLDRIGLALAGRIVEYREKHGPFEKPEDIIKVRGIGPKTFKDRIAVGDTEKNAEEEKTVKSDKMPENKDSTDKAGDEKKPSGDKKISEE